MATKNKYGFMTRKSVKKYFNALCAKSQKDSIDWKKFRRLDKKGVFREYSNVYLSLTRHQDKMRELGICVKCGKNPKSSRNLCENCLEERRVKK